MSKKQSSSNKPLKRSRSKSSCDEPVQKQKCKPIKAATKQADDKAGKNGASIKDQRCNKSKIIAEDKPSQLPRRSNRKTSQHLTEACVKTETRKKKRHSTDVSVGQQLKKQEGKYWHLDLQATSDNNFSFTSSTISCSSINKASTTKTFISQNSKDRRESK